MVNLKDIVQQLREEQMRLTRQLDAVGTALSAFGAPYTNGGRPKKRLSSAGRVRIAAAQRARWAKVRANGQKKVVTMPKKTMSTAARRKIAAAQKARWARFKANKKTA